MDEVLVFDLRGSLAHYRRPDTLQTQATYPFLPRTALRGLIGSVLGLPYRSDADILPPDCRTGLRLLAPLRTVTQQLTLHGKTWMAGQGRKDNFHRLTTLELVVAPHYRVFFSGPLAPELRRRLEQRHTHFHTYLGSAFCLTFPEWVGACTPTPVPRDRSPLTCTTVVPLDAIRHLHPTNGCQYARVTMHRDHIGDRRFRGSLAVVYEVSGRPITFDPDWAAQPFWHFYDLPEEGTICLW
ncbi:MAG: CRISPR-associated protein Cas5 [Gemmataceae bacterium]